MGLRGVRMLKLSFSAFLSQASDGIRGRPFLLLRVPPYIYPADLEPIRPVQKGHGQGTPVSPPPFVRSGTDAFGYVPIGHPHRGQGGPSAPQRCLSLIAEP